MPRCFLGLGGNTGDVAATFTAAIEHLNAPEIPVRVTRTSSIYRTTPIGSNAGDSYLNAVAEVETDLPPQALLQLTQSVEQSFGRTHTIHWGPRPLDIDILLYGDEIINRPDLTIPHPALWYRRFVLDPLTEIAADVPHPQKKGRPYQRAAIGQLRQRLLIRPFRVALASNDLVRRDSLLASLQSDFPDIEVNSISAETQSSRSTNDLVVHLNPREPDNFEGEVVAVDANSCALSIPDNDDRGLALLTAIITAATDIPEIVSGPISTAPDS